VGKTQDRLPKTSTLNPKTQDRVLWSWIEALGSAELMPIRLATTQLFLVLHGVISGL
jgi:hypothetical protein